MIQNYIETRTKCPTPSDLIESHLSYLVLQLPCWQLERIWTKGKPAISKYDAFIHKNFIRKILTQLTSSLILGTYRSWNSSEGEKSKQRSIENAVRVQNSKNRVFICILKYWTNLHISTNISIPKAWISKYKKNLPSNCTINIEKTHKL